MTKTLWSTEPPQVKVTISPWFILKSEPPPQQSASHLRESVPVTVIVLEKATETKNAKTNNLKNILETDKEKLFFRTRREKSGD
mmetsp:Transcript_367/g.520  ORF Transcript_367/g.520 Transcript_367/m.520 type:complete len:84 (-) Transcript_367:12-263(-)